MIAKMTSEQGQAYSQQVAAMDDQALAEEMGRVSLELNNMQTAVAEVRGRELAAPDLTDPAAALHFLETPPAQNSEAMQAARIIQYNLEKQLRILSNEKRGRDKRAAYGQVATHALENEKVLLKAAAIVAENQDMAARLAVAPFLPGFHPDVVKRALDKARAFTPKVMA